MGHRTAIVVTFGFERVMFGGDWPVWRAAEQLSATYVITASASLTERQRLYCDDAIGFSALETTARTAKLAEEQWDRFQQRRIGRTDLQVGGLGLGGAPLGDLYERIPPDRALCDAGDGLPARHPLVRYRATLWTWPVVAPVLDTSSRRAGRADF